MGLSAAMEIGRAALTTYRVASEVTGENIANVNTPGYSRQRVLLETAPPTTANGFPLGTGVRIATVERYYDGLLQQQMVSAQTTLGYDTTKSGVLQQIEPAFNELLNDGVGAAVSKFFGAWQDMTVNPTGTAERQSVITTANILADNFHSISRTLNDTITLQDAAVVPIVNSINATLSNIAQLNGQIKQTELVAGNANEMRDQRDQLIRELSQTMGIKFTENTDGTTDIYVQDAAATRYYLVQGTNVGSLSATPTATLNPPPATTNAVAITDVGGATIAVDPLAVPPLYTAPDGGQLWATLQLRDVKIREYLTQLNTLADSITTEVNTRHIAGFDLNGNPGIELLDPAGTTAATFGLNPLITNTNLIAAAGYPTPPPAYSGDNGNALLMTSMQNTKAIGGPPPTMTFNDYWDGLVSQIGLDVKSIKTVVSQDEAFSKQLTALRESNSGVSLDEELTNLVKYQRSYQASAKLITTATEMMDTVIAMIR